MPGNLPPFLSVLRLDHHYHEMESSSSSPSLLVVDEKKNPPSKCPHNINKKKLHPPREKPNIFLHSNSTMADTCKTTEPSESMDDEEGLTFLDHHQNLRHLSSSREEEKEDVVDPMVVFNQQDSVLHSLESPTSVFQEFFTDVSPPRSSRMNYSTTTTNTDDDDDDDDVTSSPSPTSSWRRILKRSKSLDARNDFMLQMRQPQRGRSRRWTSSPDHFGSDDNEEERKLRTRRLLCESSVQQLYEERKEHILEIFSETCWLLTDSLKDDLL